MSSYATVVDDLQAFTPAATTLSGVSQADQQKMLDAVATTADGYLQAQFTMPLVAPYPDDLRMNVCYIAYWRLLAGRRGVNPNSDVDKVWRDYHDQAMRWLEGVAAGKISPSINDSSPDEVASGGPSLVTGAQRGWSNRGNTSVDPGTPFDTDLPPRGRK